MNFTLRLVIALIGLAAAVVALGLFLQHPAATGLWPWPTSRLSNIFIAGILAAVAVPVVWIAVTNELGTTVGGAINFLVMFGGLGAYALTGYAAAPARVELLNFGIACGVILITTWTITLLVRLTPFRDSRPAPRPLRYSFMLFVGVLVLVGGGLLLGYPNIFPWPLKPEQSVSHGWIMLGSATYFLYGLWNPVMSNMKGQLMGFLVYDAVLIVPFVQHFQTVRPDLWFQLVVYVGVLVYSAAVAIYYLFIWRRR